MTVVLLFLCMRAIFIYVILLPAVYSDEFCYKHFNINYNTFIDHSGTLTNNKCLECHKINGSKYYIGDLYKNIKDKPERVGICLPLTCMEWHAKLLIQRIYNQNIIAFINLKEVSVDNCINNNNKQVAVCIEGPIGRASLNVLDSIRQNIIQPTNGKVFLVGDFDKKLNQTIADILQFLHIGLGEIDAFDIREDITRDEALMKFMNESEVGEIIIKHGWLTGREILNLKGKRRCLEIIEKWEENNLIKFDYIFYTRIDLMWLAKPPPINILENVKSNDDILWIPDSEDWRGLNDRTAIIKRQLANVYFNRYNVLINGLIMKYLNYINNINYIGVDDEIINKVDLNINPEIILKIHLLYNKITIGRYSTVAAIQICQKGQQCIGKTTKLNNGFRFIAEQSVARGNSYLINVLNWKWSTDSIPQLHPPCFQTYQEYQFCCETDAAIYGKTLCYLDGSYSFDRCCNKTIIIGLLKSSYDNLCINIIGDVKLCYHSK